MICCPPSSANDLDRLPLSDPRIVRRRPHSLSRRLRPFPVSGEYEPAPRRPSSPVKSLSPSPPSPPGVCPAPLNSIPTRTRDPTSCREFCSFPPFSLVSCNLLWFMRPLALFLVVSPSHKTAAPQAEKPAFPFPLPPITGCRRPPTVLPLGTSPPFSQQTCAGRPFSAHYMLVHHALNSGLLCRFETRTPTT